MKTRTLYKQSGGTWITNTKAATTRCTSAFDPPIPPVKRKNNMSSCINPVQNLNPKKINFLKFLFDPNNAFAMLYAALLGVSVAFNVYQHMQLKAYLDLLNNMQ